MECSCETDELETTRHQHMTIFQKLWQFPATFFTLTIHQDEYKSNDISLMRGKLMNEYSSSSTFISYEIFFCRNKYIQKDFWTKSPLLYDFSQFSFLLEGVS